MKIVFAFCFARNSGISIPFTSSSTASSGCQGTAQTWNVNWAWRAETKDLMSEVQPNANYMVFRMGGSNSLNEDLLTLGSTYQQSAFHHTK